MMRAGAPRGSRSHNFQKVYDLQNSSRTKFYKNILFPKSNSEKWSSSETTLPENKSKDEFDKIPVLERFDHQLKTSKLTTKNTLKPNFSWASVEVEEITIEEAAEEGIRDD